MGEPAKHIESAPVQSEAELAPISGERKVVEAGPENIQSVISRWESHASGDIRNATLLAVKHAVESGEPEVALELKGQQKVVLDELDKLTILTSKQVDRFMGPGEFLSWKPAAPQEVKVETIEEEPKSGVFEKIPLTIVPGAPEKEPEPKMPIADPAELKKYKDDLGAKRKELEDINKIPEKGRGEKSSHRAKVLAQEVQMMELNVTRYDEQSDLEDKKTELELLEKDLLGFLMKASPSNDFKINEMPPKERLDALIVSLPVEDIPKADMIRRREEELEKEIKESSGRLDEFAIALVGAERLLNRERAELRAYEDKEEEEARERQEKEKERKERLQRFHEQQEAEKMKKEEVSPLKRGVALGAAVGFLGTALGFFSFSKLFGFVDKGLKFLFNPGYRNEKLKWFWNKIAGEGKRGSK